MLSIALPLWLAHRVDVDTPKRSHHRDGCNPLSGGDSLDPFVRELRKAAGDRWK